MKIQLDRKPIVRFAMAFAGVLYLRCFGHLGLATLGSLQQLGNLQSLQFGSGPPH